MAAVILVLSLCSRSQTSLTRQSLTYCDTFLPVPALMAIDRLFAGTPRSRASPTERQIGVSIQVSRRHELIEGDPSSARAARPVGVVI